MEVIKNKKILATVGIIGILLGLILPYYTVTIFGYSSSIALWGYWEGKIIFILTLASGLIIFKDLIEKYIPQLFNNAVGKIVEKVNNPKIALVPTILVAGYAIYLLTELDVASEYIKYGIGFYILWIGIIALIGHAVFYKPQNKQVVEQTTTEPIHQSAPVQQPIENSQAQINQNKKSCPYCRSEVEVNALFCTNCGNKF